MFYETILPFIIVIGSFVISLIISIPLWKRCKWPWDEPEDSSDDRYERFIFERQVEKAKQTYEELKAIMGEEIDEILGGNSLNSIVETLNYIGNMASLAGCSMSELADAFNALATPSEETTETQEQKEPQVIFEPKVMIIEPEGQKPIKIAGENIISIKQDDEINPLDDWYERFMEEVKLG